MREVAKVFSQDELRARIEFLSIKAPDGLTYTVKLPIEQVNAIMEEIATHYTPNDAIEDMLFDLDEITNKPWRAPRQLAKIFDERGEHEVAAEYRKLEAFYSNGGSEIIDKSLRDPAFNFNFPEYLDGGTSREDA